MTDEPKLSRTSNEWRPARFKDTWRMWLLVGFFVCIDIAAICGVLYFCFGWL